MTARRVLLTLRFIGTPYKGWQAQPGGGTIQQAMCAAAETVFGSTVSVTGCSRTDAGVHALNYCCHIDVTASLPTDRIPHALNAALTQNGDCIAVTYAREVPHDFHARYSAVSKEYVYKLYNSAFPDPFLKERAYYIKSTLEVEKMREASEYFLGEKNFACFKASGSDIADDGAVRNITRIAIETNGDTPRIIDIYIAANGFLYNMARIIAGTLADVGKGKTDPGGVEKIIASGDRSLAGQTLPAYGLYLNKVDYDG
ncbi:tRNA pseudouridine synthase A [Clostridia bacterium]|nr:tRNA pseudouridine synthase A [Clostridia bacterium]